MQSVAVPAGSLSSPLGTEADLARAAARNDAHAFAELFHRHGQSMWRLAQAVTPDRDAAASAVGEGFVRVLRSVRRRQTSASDALRPLLLAATYRSALDLARRPEQAQRDLQATAEHLRRGEETAEAALATAAFRSLPERWRAAVWLREVEGLEPEAVAPVLGVSAAVASQLTARGRRGLLGRFEQTAMEPPAHLDAVLRPLAAAMPASLEETAAARWHKGVATDPAGRWLPAGAWMSERAARPLSIATAGVLAIGLIGLGVLGQHTGILTSSALHATGTVPGSNPGVTTTSGGSASGYTPSGGYGGLIDSPISNFLASAAYGLDGTTPSASTVAYGAGGSTPTAPTVPTSGGGGVSGPTTPSSPSTPAAPTTPTTTAPSAPTTTVPPAPSTTPTTVLSLGPVGSVTQTTAPSGGSTTSVNLIQLPGTTTPVASVSVGTCTEINLLGIAVPVSCPAGTAPGTVLPSSTTATPSSTTTPTTAPSLTSTLNNTLNGLLGGL
ncbi:hypothetical protein K6U06_11945 [Acidiferrimicrobium sp. IK]|uniref:sigma-70 family RNA polymerase sigma factor n=1 Tax=Acidiferrimicrobium sp. IK TaxID=2871700 RepID=UPI0021CB09F9|nr:sigma-70 family RNA polymerase sigma factor [Acidiferrimicrobium sp. IK]MCU4185076.1 hypothetical protein [Acidiferrimicrobium sp. IK]